MGEVWFIRHAESQSSAGLASESPGSAELTERGREEARALAGEFLRQPDLIVVSPFKRSAQTAAPLVERFPGAPLEVWPVQEFACLCPERYRSMSREERQLMVEDYWRWRDPLRLDGPGAESFAGFLQRLAGVLDRLGSLDGFCAVFTHGNAMRGLLCLLLLGAEAACGSLERSMDLVRSLSAGLPIANLAVLKVRFAPGGKAWLSGFPLARAGEG